MESPNEPSHQDGPKELEKPSGEKAKSRVSLVLVYGGIFAFLTAWAGLLGNLGHTFWIFAAIVMLVASVCLAFGLGLELRNHHWLKWQYNGIACLIVIVGFSLGLPVIVRELFRDDPSNQPSESNKDESGNPIGLLLPANGPMPSAITKVIDAWHSRLDPNHSFFVVMGENVVAVNKQGAIPLVRFVTNLTNEADFLVLNVEAGGAYLTGKFCDENSKIIVKLETNHFTINRLNYLNKHIDKHTLAVEDQRGVEVLNARFSSANVFVISGRFMFPNGKELIVTETNILYGSNPMRGNFSEGIGAIRVTDTGKCAWGIFTR